MMIREMLPEDAPRVLAIYKQGVDSGKATFTTQCPTWEVWDRGHHKCCRYVAVCEGEVAAFAALSPVSDRPHYKGVAEVMVYVDEAHWHQGLGEGLLRKLIEEAPGRGFWCLYSSIYSTNENSIRLHQKCGFRLIGYRERLAKDKFGNWMDTTMMEYRFPDEIVKEV